MLFGIYEQPDIKTLMEKGQVGIANITLKQRINCRTQISRYHNKDSDRMVLAIEDS